MQLKTPLVITILVLFIFPKFLCAQTIVQSNHTATLGSPTSVVFSSSVGATHLLIVTYASANDVGAVVSSTQSDSFSNAILTNIGTVAYRIAYACSAVGGSTTINVSNLSSYAIVQIFEVSGNATSTCLDATGSTAHSPGGGSENSTTATTSGSVSQSNELVFAFFGQNTGGALTTCSATGAFTNKILDTSSASFNSCARSAVGNATSGLSGTQSVTFTNDSSGGAGSIIAGIATFKLSGAAVNAPRSHSTVL